MPITCLVIGDQHFQDSNIEQVDELVHKTLNLAREVDPTFIVLLGDLLHTKEKIYITPLKRGTDFIQALSEIACTYVLIGNHDYKNASQFLTDEHAFTPLKLWPNTHIADTVIIHEFQLESPNEGGVPIPLRFAFCPYVPNGRFLEALNTEMWETCECVFAHQEIKGAKMGGKVSDCDDEWDVDYPLLISGHIHEHQFVGPNMIYTGSAMQHGATDDGDKYIFEFSFHGAGNWEMKKHDLNLKRKKKITVNVDDVGTLSETVSEYDNVILTIEVVGMAEQIKKFKGSKMYKTLVKRGIRFLSSTTVIPVEALEGFSIEDEPSSKNRSFIEVLDSIIASESETVKREYATIMKELGI